MVAMTNQETVSTLDALILTPTGQDAKLLSKVVEQQGFKTQIYDSYKTLCEKIIRSEGSVVLIAEEALTKISIPALNHALSQQEPWSDIPIVLLTSNGQETTEELRRIKAFAPSGNVTLLERPLRPMTLLNTLNVCLRARIRQYQVRDLLLDLMAAAQRREEFISIASHELKTPITAMSLQIQLHQRLIKNQNPMAFDPAKVIKVLDGAEKQLGRLRILVDDMLDVTRISAGHLTLTKTEVNLSELIKEIVERTDPQLNFVGCSVELDLAPQLVGIWDRFRIEQIINNLLTNVIRYAPGAAVLIKTESQNGFAVLSIKDSGTGISENDQKRIFTRFERAVAHNSISGLGLGLYICKQIVELHGGNIGVNSKIGEGATFTVSLPV
jgi:signal transduction histidine kinase